MSDVGAIRLELDGRLSADQDPFRALVNSGQSTGRQISGILRNSNRSVLLGKVRGDGGMVSTNGLSDERYTADWNSHRARPWSAVCCPGEGRTRLRAAPAGKEGVAVRDRSPLPLG